MLLTIQLKWCHPLESVRFDTLAGFQRRGSSGWAADGTVCLNSFEIECSSVN
jgi:hypothetical protein